MHRSIRPYSAAPLIGIRSHAETSWVCVCHREGGKKKTDYLLGCQTVSKPASPPNLSRDEARAEALKPRADRHRRSLPVFQNSSSCSFIEKLFFPACARDDSEVFVCLQLYMNWLCLGGFLFFFFLSQRLLGVESEKKAKSFSDFLRRFALEVATLRVFGGKFVRPV